MSFVTGSRFESNPVGQTFFKPLLQCRAPSAQRQLLDTQPDFAIGDDTGEKNIRSGGFEPLNYSRIRLRPGELGDNVGIDQETVHRLMGRG